MEESQKEKFLKLLESMISEIHVIDKDTEWQPVEPGWWLDMVDLQRKAIKIKEKYANRDKV